MDDYLKLAKEIAAEAAQIALTYFNFEIKTTWKSNNTPLTEADTEINSLVIKKIRAIYPDHGILGEEESDLKKGSECVWVCDPIDGTIPFSNGLPLFTFSLALIDQSNGQPILGLVNDPVMKHMYWACSGGGAYRNGKRISVSRDATLRNTYLNVGCSQTSGEFSGMSAIVSLRNAGANVMELLSVVYGGIQVANGKFSGTIFFEPFAHDVAALKIITEEAGGKVTDLKGGERRYDGKGLGCVVSNGAVHKEILALLR